MRFSILLSLFLFVAANSILAQGSYEIKVELDGFKKDTLVLGYYLGNNQYVRDTAVRQKNEFVFKGDETLPTGMYMIIIPPLNEAIQLVIDDDQEFEIKGRYDNGPKDIEFKGSKENDLYYHYVNFIQEKRPKTERLRKEMDSLEVTSDEYQDLAAQIQAIDEEVKSRTQKIIDENPDSYTALILKINQPIDIPEFEGSEEEVKLKRFHYYKGQYLSNMFLTDERAFRTPYLYERTNYYTDKLTMRSPDSIIGSVDQILEPLMEFEDAFQYYLVHFLNKYAKSKVVGQDAVYVHIADKYYSTGKAPWTDDEQLTKILKNAQALKPTLIGEIAPNLTLFDRDKNPVKIHDIEATYTILYFWNPDCGHCKKSTPKLIEFQKEYADMGIRVVTVCGKTGKDYGECWNYIDEREDMDILYNLGDEFYRSRFKTLFYVKTTPKIYVLGADKEIVSKGIGVEQLGELINYLEEEKNK